MPMAPIPAAARYWISGRAEPAGSDHEHAAAFSRLSRPSHITENQMAGVAVDLVELRASSGLIDMARAINHSGWK